MSKKKILVCRVGEEPKVEEVDDVFSFTSELVDHAYIETQTIVVDQEEVTAFFAENVGNKLKFNRNIPAVCPYIPEDVDFVVDTRKMLPEFYAKSGQLGFYRIHGHFVLTKIVNGGHRSLSERAIKTFSALLEVPKCKRCNKNPLAYPGAVYCGAGCSARAEAGD